MNEDSPEKPLSRADNPDPIDVHVGARLRLRRNILGLSQGQLGEATGLTFQQIQKYERGANRMGASRLFQIARLLGVQVSYFFEQLPIEATIPENACGFGETGQAQPEGMPDFDTAVLHSRETIEVIRAYYRISDPKQRRKIFELIKTMAGE